MILSRLDEAFRNSTLILNDEGNQTILSKLDEASRISILILDYEDDEPGFARLTCLAFSHHFIWTPIISSGAALIAGWLEVVTLSETHPLNHLN